MVREPSERLRSPGPISANPNPGTARIASQLATPSGLSSFTPSNSSPFGLSGQGSQRSMYSSLDRPQIGAAVVSDPRPRVPMPSQLRPAESEPPSLARIAPSIRASGDGIAGSTPTVLCG